MPHVFKGERYRSALLPIPSLNNTPVRVIVVGRSVYFPIRGVCAALGLTHRMQRVRLQADSRFANDLRILPVRTTQGDRDTLCIRKPMVAAWLLIIDPPHCKHASTRERLAEFQAQLFAAADRFLWGKVEAVEAPMVRESLITGLLHVGPCPVCGARLCLILDESGAHLTPEPEEEE